ncbi:MAG TPA: beta-N-acetylhexosaminidase [Candidatus Cloacimonadota bacterium]|nr:beta-N-acetylhexosaminidase [Candidatus Cloacimonadota bacterium]
MIPLAKDIEKLPGLLRLGQLLEISSAGALMTPNMQWNWDRLCNWYSKKDLTKLTPYKPVRIKINKFPALPATSPEMYALIVASDGITISVSSDSGFRNAVATLRQLLYLALQSGDEIECQRIIDEPKFKWRGLHLDVSRHYFDKEFILLYLDWMASLKLNVFHWHLTDDQGWRIESKRYPRLTEVGAWRREEDGSVYGGFYTQNEIREIVAYATELGIEVVPEIDIPGHALALLSAYPEHACFPREFEPISCWGITDDVLCAGNPKTITFLKDLLEELTGLFPGRYFHIGGDEVPTTKWSSCPKCQNLKQEKNLPSDIALQSHLIKELEDHLRKLGKELVGWDEILDGGIAKEPIVMVWRGDGKDAAKRASTQGNRFVLCPNHYLYFDWKPSAAPDEKGAFGVTDLDKVYSFAPEDYLWDRPDLLLGCQANLWTERIYNHEDVKYMLIPRIYALAEIVWTDPRKRNLLDFRDRLAELEEFI